jgi:hypothetical protein
VRPSGDETDAPRSDPELLRRHDARGELAERLTLDGYDVDLAAAEQQLVALPVPAAHRRRRAA